MLICGKCYVGFQWDRYWLAVNYKGRAYTQKVEPKLALVESELPKEAFFEDWKPTKNSFLGEYSVNKVYKVLYEFIILIIHLCSGKSSWNESFKDSID